MPIALLTDFGTRNYYVGAMKGVILSINPDASIVDITHEIEPQDIVSAAFILRACYRDFPVDTIFLCVVDPGVGSQRRAIIVQTEKHLFVGPDNGLSSFVLNKHTTVHAIENEQYFCQPVSFTFHGRDIFAPVAAHLSKGVGPAEFGARISDPVLLPDTHPWQINEDTIEGTVIHVDRFGNLVTNLPAGLADRIDEIAIAETRVTQLERSYAQAKSNQPFAIVGSAGFIEISVNRGSAAEVLKSSFGTKVTVRLK
jgi:S-adenosyl-L-methionine hydrolase (adenosine-forming)